MKNQYMQVMIHSVQKHIWEPFEIGGKWKSNGFARYNSSSNNNESTSFANYLRKS